MAQMEALKHVMTLEQEHQNTLEKERAKIAIFAANPAMYQKLFEENNLDDGEIDWIVPKSAEDAAEWIRYLEGLHIGEDQIGP